MDESAHITRGQPQSPIEVTVDPVTERTPARRGDDLAFQLIGQMGSVPF